MRLFLLICLFSLGFVNGEGGHRELAGQYYSWAKSKAKDAAWSAASYLGGKSKELAWWSLLTGKDMTISVTSAAWNKIYETLKSIPPELQKQLYSRYSDYAILSQNSQLLVDTGPSKDILAVSGGRAIAIGKIGVFAVLINIEDLENNWDEIKKVMVESSGYFGQSEDQCEARGKSTHPDLDFIYTDYACDDTRDKYLIFQIPRGMEDSKHKELGQLHAFNLAHLLRHCPPFLAKGDKTEKLKIYTQT